MSNQAPNPKDWDPQKLEEKSPAEGTSRKQPKQKPHLQSGGNLHISTSVLLHSWLGSGHTWPSWLETGRESGNNDVVKPNYRKTVIHPGFHSRPAGHHVPCICWRHCGSALQHHPSWRADPVQVDALLADWHQEAGALLPEWAGFTGGPGWKFPQQNQSFSGRDEAWQPFLKDLQCPVTGWGRIFLHLQTDWEPSNNEIYN